MTPRLWFAAMSAGAIALNVHEPRAITRDVTLYEFTFSGLPQQPIRRPGGEETWRVQNTGRELHEVTVLRLADSSSLGDVDAWVAGGASLLLPPAEVALHIDALLPGAEADRTIRLDAGVYVVICLVPIERRGNGSFEHHADRGMRTTFVVSSSAN